MCHTQLSTWLSLASSREIPWSLRAPEPGLQAPSRQPLLVLREPRHQLWGILPEGVDV